MADSVIYNLMIVHIFHFIPKTPINKSALQAEICCHSELYHNFLYLLAFTYSNSMEQKISMAN